MSCESSSFTIITQTQDSAPTTHTALEILLSGVWTRTLQRLRPSGSAEKPRPLLKAFQSRSPYLPSNQQESKDLNISSEKRFHTSLFSEQLGYSTTDLFLY